MSIYGNPVMMGGSGGGGGGSVSDGAKGVFDAMVAVRAAGGNDNYYSAIASVFLSVNSGDRFTCNGRWFQRSDSGLVLVTYGDATQSETDSFFGYNLYTKTSDAISGTYSEYGSLYTAQAKTSPSGNIYYRRVMASPWGGSASGYNVTVSNNNTTIVTLKNNDLFTSSAQATNKNAFIGALADLLFFGVVP